MWRSPPDRLCWAVLRPSCFVSLPARGDHQQLWEGTGPGRWRSVGTVLICLDQRQAGSRRPKSSGARVSLSLIVASGCHFAHNEDGQIQVSSRGAGWHFPVGAPSPTHPLSLAFYPTGESPFKQEGFRSTGRSMLRPPSKELSLLADLGLWGRTSRCLVCCRFLQAATLRKRLSGALQIGCLSARLF